MHTSYSLSRRSRTEDRVVFVRPSSSSAATVPIDAPAKRDTVAPAPAVVKAVMAHIKALRMLGERRANTAEIAKALGLTRDAVELAVRGLRSQGIKPVK